MLLTDDELEAVELETVRTIDIDKFVPRESIEWVYLETPHYLLPNDKIGNEAFAVIRDAMKADDVLGISRVVIGRRERAAVLEPRGKGIVVWTLRFGDEVRPEGEYFQDIEKKADPKTVEAIKKMITADGQMVVIDGDRPHTGKPAQAYRFQEKSVEASQKGQGQEG